MTSGSSDPVIVCVFVFLPFVKHTFKVKTNSTYLINQCIVLCFFIALSEEKQQSEKSHFSFHSLNILVNTNSILDACTFEKRQQAQLLVLFYPVS